MKQFLSGAGVDTTATVLAAIKANATIFAADLYLIGEDDDPRALWLTNWETPLSWPLWGTFQSTNIKRGNVTSKIGLESPDLEVTWSPLNQAITASLETASPYQLARLGQFDNWRVRMWRTYMPTPGDANTWGAAEWFAGWIGDVKPWFPIVFTVNNYLYCLNQKVPTGVIEPTNTLASYSGGVPPSGYDVMPQFAIVSGSTEVVLLADQTSPHAGTIPGTNSLANGYVVFNGGPNATLRGAYSIIAANSNFDAGGGVHHTQIQLYSPLPWAPTPGVDTFYVSSAAPITQADGDYFGFPYVPAPETAA